jgi:hypothetical protein
MKGICFTFDAFGQWSEHDRSKMKWKMNVGIEWWPSMAGRPKIGGRLLMRKFVRSGKTGCSDFLFRTVQFQQVQNMKMARAKLGDKIQGVLKQEVGLKGIKGLWWTKIKQEAKVAKTG